VTEKESNKGIHERVKEIKQEEDGFLEEKEIRDAVLKLKLRKIVEINNIPMEI